MTARKIALALSVIVASWAAPAASQEVAPDMTAPAGTSETRYCMRVAAATGSHVERVKCWTREQWSAQGVEVDRDWPREGVRVIG